DDLAGREVAREAERAGRAEAAGERAADLGRDAERVSPLLRDEDGLDPSPVEGAEQQLLRAVDRTLLGDDLERLERELRRDLAAQTGGQIAHLLEIGRVLLVEPARDLVRAIGGPAPPREERAQRRTGVILQRR